MNEEEEKEKQKDFNENFIRLTRPLRILLPNGGGKFSPFSTLPLFVEA